MFKGVIALLLSNLLTGPLSAMPIYSVPESIKENISEVDDVALYKASVYTSTPLYNMGNANWIYLGYVPRMMDAKRASITISKAAFTLRVTLEMTEQEVADYPKYLIDRADRLSEIMDKQGLSILQPTLWKRYQNKISEVRASSNGTYSNGLNWLKAMFPKNIFELSTAKVNGAKVIAHFVYPVTMVRQGNDTAPDGTYYTYDFEERKTLHKAGTYTDPETGQTRTRWDNIFGGFPALWFFATENGIGIHGPIRFSEKHENARNGQSIPKFWAENDEFKDEDRTADITAAYRWSVVRTKDSAGCVRSESMEIRHLLPSKVAGIKQVPIHMISKWDQVEIDGKISPVNVEYYSVDPYLPQLSKAAWLQSLAPNMLSMANEMINFPYLNPHTIEFKNKRGLGDLQSMTLLNEAPFN